MSKAEVFMATAEAEVEQLKAEVDKLENLIANMSMQKCDQRRAVLDEQDRCAGIINALLPLAKTPDAKQLLRRAGIEVLGYQRVAAKKKG